MIDFNPSGFWSAGFVTVMWGLSDNRWDLTLTGALLIAISLVWMSLPSTPDSGER